MYILVLLQSPRTAYNDAVSFIFTKDSLTKMPLKILPGPQMVINQNLKRQFHNSKISQDRALSQIRLASLSAVNYKCRGLFGLIVITFKRAKINTGPSSDFTLRGFFKDKLQQLPHHGGGQERQQQRHLKRLGGDKGHPGQSGSPRTRPTCRGGPASNRHRGRSSQGTCRGRGNVPPATSGPRPSPGCGCRLAATGCEGLARLPPSFLPGTPAHGSGALRRSAHWTGPRLKRKQS